MKRLLVLGLLLAASPAWAQRIELAILAGYTSSGSIDQTAAGIQELKVEGGFTWGLEATHFFSTHLGVEVSWAQQQSALALGTASGSAALFDMNAGQLHGNFIYQFGGDGARLKPFVFGGLGTSFLSAQNLETETKLSWALGGGVKWFPAEIVGAKLHVRFNPTRLNDTSSDFCDPFGFCQGSLQQFEIMGGVVLRF